MHGLISLYIVIIIIMLILHVRVIIYIYIRLVQDSTAAERDTAASVQASWPTDILAQKDSMCIHSKFASPIMTVISLYLPSFLVEDSSLIPLFIVEDSSVPLFIVGDSSVIVEFEDSLHMDTGESTRNKIPSSYTMAHK